MKKTDPWEEFELQKPVMLGRVRSLAESVHTSWLSWVRAENLCSMIDPWLKRLDVVKSNGSFVAREGADVNIRSFLDFLSKAFYQIAAIHVRSNHSKTENRSIELLDEFISLCPAIVVNFAKTAPHLFINRSVAELCSRKLTVDQGNVFLRDIINNFNQDMQELATIQVVFADKIVEIESSGGWDDKWFSKGARSRIADLVSDAKQAQFTEEAAKKVAFLAIISGALKSKYFGLIKECATGYPIVASGIVEEFDKKTPQLRLLLPEVFESTIRSISDEIKAAIGKEVKREIGRVGSSPIDVGGVSTRPVSPASGSSRGSSESPPGDASSPQPGVLSGGSGREGTLSKTSSFGQLVREKKASEQQSPRSV